MTKGRAIDEPAKHIKLDLSLCHIFRKPGDSESALASIIGRPGEHDLPSKESIIGRPRGA